MNSWKRFKFRIRGWLIDGLNSLLNLLVDQPPEPTPDAVERAKAAKTHSFVVRLEWDAEDQTYFALGKMSRTGRVKPGRTSAPSRLSFSPRMSSESDIFTVARKFP